MNVAGLLRWPRLANEVRPEPDTVPDLRTFCVVAYWPEHKKVTFWANGLKDALERQRLAFAAGATRVEVEPEWSKAALR